MKKLTNEDFINKAQKIHGNRYDYSNVIYKNAKTKVKIICKVHGEFLQIPDKHLQGHNCPICNCKKKRTTKEFIERARKVHGNKYDYSNGVYKNKNSKICIICPEHGEFWQNAHNHLSGNGCPKCSKRFRYKTNDFIEKASIIHNGKYDYSGTQYLNTKTKIKIICPIHGEFWQLPEKHIIGNGCPRCSESKMERGVAKFLQENHINFEIQKTFPWLNRQRLDFYLPDYKLAIECQGEQHFKPVDFAGRGKVWAKKQFNESIERDKLKKSRCESKGVRVLYYTNLKEKKTHSNDKIITELSVLLENITKHL